MKINIIQVKGESHERLEDFHVTGFNGSVLKIAVGDWASNLVGGPYRDGFVSRALISVKEHWGSPARGVNGGVIGAHVARGLIAESTATGYELIEEINSALASKYAYLIKKGYDSLKDYKSRRELAFTGYIAHLIITPEKMDVTTVGDVRVAADDKLIAGERKAVDIRNAQLRAEYIRRTGDVEGGFDYIRPRILEQFSWQNVPGREFSYPAIDGTETLRGGVETLALPTPKRILVWTDGYLPPDDFTIEGLERKLQEVYHIDPHRCREFPAVGFLTDDRTAVEITELDNWSVPRVEYAKPSFKRI